MQILRLEFFKVFCTLIVCRVAACLLRHNKLRVHYTVLSWSVTCLSFTHSSFHWFFLGQPTQDQWPARHLLNRSVTDSFLVNLFKINDQLVLYSVVMSQFFLGQPIQGQWPARHSNRRRLKVSDQLVIYSVVVSRGSILVSLLKVSDQLVIHSVVVSLVFLRSAYKGGVKGVIGFMPNHTKSVKILTSYLLQLP